MVTNMNDLIDPVVLKANIYTATNNTNVKKLEQRVLGEAAKQGGQGKGLVS